MDIDYEAVTAALQHENEQLRLRIVGLLNAKQPWDGLDGTTIRKFVAENSMVISACALLFFVLCSFIGIVREFFTDKDKK